ncbi:hypothetical protein [Methylobacterium oryzihabitans]|uniref:Uncharacterized protein n=1 Tax=Methylobacterium oryzihabitans TaxID=2499852 RepID=A0A3S2XJ87_9HYPH|nr:hypothetical protein [Methylobacterium oryzihabitans]RVU16139.1 hypothetical protein EOE48_17440 [Methylobacterium oryzihabitans]
MQRPPMELDPGQDLQPTGWRDDASQDDIAVDLIDLDRELARRPHPIVVQPPELTAACRADPAKPG